MSNSEQTVFFIDRCLGSQYLAQALRVAGACVEVHDDHFPQSAQDENWLPTVGERGWIVLTKDARIAKRTSERLAVASAQVRMFVLTSQNLSGQDMIDAFRQALSAMQEFVESNPAPFIAKVHRDGTVSAWKTEQDLTRELQDFIRDFSGN